MIYFIDFLVKILIINHFRNILTINLNLEVKNFIVSGLKELWIDEINDKYILDPFIFYELKKGNYA